MTKATTPSARRRALLDGAVHFLCQHGVAGMSLRPLATRLGTSARMLMFHFGGKDELIAAVLDDVHARLHASFTRIADQPGRGANGPMRRFWSWATMAENLPCLRLLYEVQLLAAQNPKGWAHHLRRISFRWLRSIEPHLPPTLRTRAMATLCAAVFDGLLLEVLGTGDLRRTGRALDQFVGFLLQHLEKTSPAPRSKVRIGGSRGSR